MTREAVAEPSEGRRFKRVVGAYDRGRPGPTVVVMGGIHGNEPGGVLAAERVLRRLGEEQPPFSGRLVALAGNLEALERNQRFMSRDLNRRWLPASIEGLLARDESSDDTEDREQRELLGVFGELVAQAQGPVVYLDLHTASAEGAPFTCMSDTLTNRRVAMAMPQPVILGLEEAIDGAVLDYWTERRLPGLAVEGGQHAAESTIRNLEAAIWLVLDATGCLSSGAVVDLEEMRTRLASAAAGLPPVLEIRYHHKITPSDQFVMRPGYRTFQRVRKGEVLAQDRAGPIRAVESGYVLLPLYQGQGEDGFFLARPVRPFWLKVSAALRRSGVDRLLPLLPGVRRMRGRPDSLMVDRRVARWLVLELFHLLGYRRRRRADARRWIFTKRRTASFSRTLPWRDRS